MIPEKIIDFHTHLFPDRLFKAIRDYFSKTYSVDLICDFDYRGCIDFLRQNNVREIVYSTYAHKEGIAEELNRWNLKILEENPDIYCFGAFHPGDEHDPEFMEEFLSHPRVLGYKLHLLVQRFYPHDRRLYPLYETIVDKTKRILLHAGTGPIPNEYVGYDSFMKVLRKFPELGVNVAHLGGLEYRKFFELLDEYPNIYLDTAFVFLPDLPWTYNLGPEYLEKYQDRLLYGSDFPFLSIPREVEIEALVKYNLSPEFYRKVFYENGKRLLEAVNQ